MAALYPGGILKPTTSLRHFPVAVVNQDVGPVGKQVVNGVVLAVDPDKFDVRVLSRQEALDKLDTAKVYGAAVIPPDFSSKLRDLPQSAVNPGRRDGR